MNLLYFVSSRMAAGPSRIIPITAPAPVNSPSPLPLE